MAKKVLYIRLSSGRNTYVPRYTVLQSLLQDVEKIIRIKVISCHNFNFLQLLLPFYISNI
jgi:hypothetical protein